MSADYLMNRELRTSLISNPVDTVKTVSDSVLREIIADTEGSENGKIIALHNAAVLESVAREWAIPEWEAYPETDLTK